MGSFWLGTAINLFVAVAAYIISTLTGISLIWIQFPVLILIGLGIYLLGMRVFHPVWFTIGLIMGLGFIIIIFLILVLAGLLAFAFIFGA